MSKYKRLRGKNFVVDYPAALWSALSPQEQTEIAKFYNSTYGKTAAAAGKTERANGTTNGRYSSGLR